MFTLDEWSDSHSKCCTVEGDCVNMKFIVTMLLFETYASSLNLKVGHKCEAVAC